jgi:hypothetical protein
MDFITFLFGTVFFTLVLGILALLMAALLGWGMPFIEQYFKSGNK